MNLRLLVISFKNELLTESLTSFRGALIEKVGRDCGLFHNHTEEGFRHGYPLIQYKVINARYSMVAINEGVAEIYHLFSKPNWRIDIKGRPYDLEVDELSLRNATADVTTQLQTYSIKRWQALNPVNYLRFRKLATISEKIEMLERMLIGNIISFAKGIKWQIEEKVVVEILEIPEQRKSRVKDVEVETFDIIFRTNVLLPSWISLGKGASTGFGVIKKVKNKTYD